MPERERTEAPPRTPWGWLFAIFQISEREVIKKCGLDAYFFLRYLRSLLVIFVPMAVIIIPILLPLNQLGGRGPSYALEFQNADNPDGTSATANVTGLDVLAWTNVRPEHITRYWAHLMLAILVVVWVCGVCFAELKVYIKIRQDYLTSAEHRLRASATTVLVSAIPQKWLTKEALGGLYDVFPGGIRNIWINRNYDELLDKIKRRNIIFTLLENAETELIQKAKKAHKKQAQRDEKYSVDKSKQQNLTKQQKEQLADTDAQRLAQEDGPGGDADRVPHTVDAALDEEENLEQQQERHQDGRFKIPVIGRNLAAVGQGFGKGIGVAGQGLGRGLGVAGKAGNTVIGGARVIGKDINKQLETTNGFVNLDEDSTNEEREQRINDAWERTGVEQDGAGKPSSESKTPFAGHDSTDFANTTQFGNATRKQTYPYGADNGSDALTGQESWWKFWKPPAGSFPSPIPIGYEGDEVALGKDNGKEATKKTFWAKLKSIIPCMHDDKPEIEYPMAYNPDYKEEEHPAAWQRYLKKGDRPTYRIPKFNWTPGWLPGIPYLNKKVDTIYWCRVELARLNLEIEMDQKSPERFPLMNSAFIQFNHQVAAHMACQAVTHHVPRHMAPRTVEIAPDDVIWDNMSIKWWELWLRNGVVLVIVAGMVVLWAIPVAWTSTFANITYLAAKYHWLHWLNAIPKKLIQAISGVLPALVLSILLVIVPLLLKFLAYMQGCQTGTEQQGALQTYYFAFLFVQVFLVVSVSAGAVLALGSTAATVTSIPETLASQLPKSANYFFSYMILQALSTSSGTILQLFTLICWFILPPIFDNTARQKWSRQTKLPHIQWGTYFPVYTNFACIALIYSVVSPIIIIFAIITFSLLWIANRYNMLYVSRFRLDTGGLLYPRAIIQLFTGLYVMELCLIGLFFITHNADGNALIAQAIVMIVVFLLTILYQILLNKAFAPLLRYLPITFEDEAVIRDQAFERAQARRLGLEGSDDDEAVGLTGRDDIPLSNLGSPDEKQRKGKPNNIIRHVGTWALHHSKTVKAKTFDRETVRQRRRHDVEAQHKIRDALYGSYNDEIEDLDPEERNKLVKHAFRHQALRARKPILWIPKDDIGVSDDEIKRTRVFAGDNIWIDNSGAAINGKGKVVYGKSPPDFSEVDLIAL